MLVELKSGETYNGQVSARLRLADKGPCILVPVASWQLERCDNWMNLNLREVICTSRVRPTGIPATVYMMWVRSAKIYMLEAEHLSGRTETGFGSYRRCTSAATLSSTSGYPTRSSTTWTSRTSARKLTVHPAPAGSRRK